MQLHFMAKEGQWFDEAKTLQAGKALLRSSGLKFLLFIGPEEVAHLVLAAAFSDSLEHAKVAQQAKLLEPTWTLTGAGYVTGSDLYFKSDSCREKYGFDGPGDPDEERRLREASKALLVEKGIMSKH